MLVEKKIESYQPVKMGKTSLGMAVRSRIVHHPPNLYVEVLTLSTFECACIGTRGI